MGSIENNEYRVYRSHIGCNEHIGNSHKCIPIHPYHSLVYRWPLTTIVPAQIGQEPLCTRVSHLSHFSHFSHFSHLTLPIWNAGDIPHIMAHTDHMIYIPVSAWQCLPYWEGAGPASHLALPPWVHQYTYACYTL